MMPSNSADDLPPNSEDAFLLSLMESFQSWKQFDLTSRKSSIESNALQSKEYREASLAARKKLLELTKSLKKAVKSSESAASAVTASGSNNDNDNDAVTVLVSNVNLLTKSCGSTIKLYQEEIDNLTRRCKTSDGTFMDLYKPIQNLPDPGPIIENASLRLNNKNGQVTHLLKGMEEMHKEMEESKQQYEFEISSVKSQQEQERLQMENRIEAQTLEAKNAANSNNLSREDKEELIDLRKEVTEYEVEFRSLKNQDITIKNLKTTIEEMAQNHDENLNSELEKARDEISKTEGQRAADALEREATMERRLQSVELELRAERAGREATQTHLLEADEGASEREAAWEAQRQLILNDADRLREALHEVTREKNELNLQLDSVMNSNPQNERGFVSNELSTDTVDFQLERKAYGDEIDELGITVVSLREELHGKEGKVTEIQSSMQATIDEMSEVQKALKTNLNSMSTQLKSAPSIQTYELMKRELRILKKLEYNAGDIDVESNSMSKEGNEDDLETVLITKLRKAESELLKERREKVEQVKECEEMRKQVIIVEKEKAKADDLASRLEIDLERVIASANEGIDESSSQGSFMEIPFAAPSDPSILQKIIDPTAPPLPMSSSPPAIPSPPPKKEKAKDHSVATIVMAQRDRLRNRCDIVEAERDSFKQELQVQVSVADSLKSDNTKLYEKVRYLQNYNSSNNNSSRHSTGKSKTNMNDIDLEALEQNYEASVDPFRQFSRAERQRKLKEMSTIERIVFIFSKTLLGNKMMRTFLFFYVMSMHLLVFFTTYHISHEVRCQNHMIHEEYAQSMTNYDPVQADIAAAKAAVGISH